MRFTHSISNADYDVLALTSDHGVQIKISFDKSEALDVYIDDNIELSALDDNLSGLFVSIDGVFYAIDNIIREAEKQIDDIIAETRAEEEAENSMIAELSSPYFTGRI